MPDWSASTSSSICWQQVSRITDTTEGMDFMPLYVNDQFPWAVNDDRPCYFTDTPDTDL